MMHAGLFSVVLLLTRLVLGARLILGILILLIQRGLSFKSQHALPEGPFFLSALAKSSTCLVCENSTKPAQIDWVGIFCRFQGVLAVFRFRPLFGHLHFYWLDSGFEGCQLFSGVPLLERT